MDLEDPDGLMGSGAAEGPSKHSSEESSDSEAPPAPPRSARARLTPRLLLLVLVAAAAGFLFGYDTSAIGEALHFMALERASGGLAPLSSFMVGLITAATPCGAVFGALSGGVLADKYGRKPAVMLAGVVFTLGAGVMAFSMGEAMLVIGRFIVGLGVGLVSMVVPVYLAESSPESMRGAIVTLNILFVTGGQFFAYCCAIFLQNVKYQWRWILGISAIPAIIQFVGMMFLSETPRWLISHGLLADARRALTALRGDAAVAQRDAREITIAVKSERRGTLSELVSDWSSRRALLLACGILIIQQLCAINTVMYYVPEILKFAGIPDADVVYWSLIPAGTNAAGTVIGMFMVDRFGRRILLLLSLAGVIVTLLIMGVILLLSVTFSYVSPFANVWTLVGYLLCFAPGLGPVPWAISSEIFSVKVRGLGTSISTACNWLSNFLISVTFPLLITSVGISNVFFGYAVLAILSFLFVYFLLPETKGLTLEEIQVMLRENPHPQVLCGRQRIKVSV